MGPSLAKAEVFLGHNLGSSGGSVNNVNFLELYSIVLDSHARRARLMVSRAREEAKRLECMECDMAVIVGETIYCCASAPDKCPRWPFESQPQGEGSSSG